MGASKVRTSIIEQRNASIYKAMDDGSEVSTLASLHRLSERTIRDIYKRMSDQYAAANPGAGMLGGTGTNGNGQSARGGSAFGEVGKSGLKQSWGYLHEEFLREMSNSQARYRMFNEMRQNSPVLASLLLAIELSIKRVEWRIDGSPNGQEGEDERTAFLDGALKDMSHSLTDHITEVLTMLPFGFSAFEIVYKRRQGENATVGSQFYDGKIGWQKLAMRSQESLHHWGIDETGGITGMWQMPWPDFTMRWLPIEKLVLYRTTSEKGNPEGRSLLRPAYVPYYYVKNLQAIEAIGAERDLAGLPMIKMPENADTAEGSKDLENAEKIVRRVRQDEQAGAVIPFGWEFTLLSASGRKAVDVAAIIERYERRMAMSALAQFLMLGMDKIGSHALSKDHSDFFLMAVSAFADNIAATFNQYAIPRLLKLNGMSTIDAPQLVHGALGDPDLAQIATAVYQLAPGGFIKPDDDLETWLRELLNAPELTQEVIDARKEQTAKQPPPPPPGQPGQPGINPLTGKPGDGQQMGDGKDMPMGKMSLREQIEQFSADGRSAHKRVKGIPDDGLRKRVIATSKGLTALNEKLVKESLAGVKAITAEEWQSAVEADAVKERANGKG